MIPLGAYRWQRPTLRFLVVLTLPLVVGRLSRELGFLESLGFVANLFPVLSLSPLSPEESAVALAVALLALIAVLAENRAPQHAVGLAVSATLWLGFVYSTLRWFRLLPGTENLLVLDEPTTRTLLLAFALLGIPVLYLCLDAFFQARESYQDRAIPAEEAAPAARVIAQGIALALAGGLATAILLSFGFWRIRQTIAEGATAFSVNPVAGLLLLGLGFALLLAALARPRDLAGKPTPFFQAPPETPDASIPPPAAPPPTPTKPSEPAAGTEAWIAREMEIERQRRGERGG